MIPRIEISFPLSRQVRFIFGKGKTNLAETDFYLNHARSGIVLALRTLGIGQGNRVGIMTYNCRSVMDAIVSTGAEIVFIDITEQLQININDLENKVEGLDALVISHLFGIVNDVQKIRRLYPKLPIIEDCAHSFEMASLSGDFAVYSVGLGKIPSIGDGGILIVNNITYLPKVNDIYQHLPGYNLTGNIKLYVRMLLMALFYSPFFYEHITIPLIKEKRKHIKASPIKIRKMSDRILAIYSKEIDRIVRDVENRKQNASFLYSKTINYTGVRSVLLGENAFMLVILCEDVRPIKKEFTHCRTEVATHFKDCISWAKCYGYTSGNCPMSEYLTNHLIMVPTYRVNGKK